MFQDYAEDPDDTGNEKENIIYVQRLSIKRPNIMQRLTMDNSKIIQGWYTATTYLQTHYGNGVFGNVYILALNDTKR